MLPDGRGRQPGTLCMETRYVATSVPSSTGLLPPEGDAVCPAGGPVRHGGSLRSDARAAVVSGDGSLGTLCPRLTKAFEPGGALAAAAKGLFSSTYCMISQSPLAESVAVVVSLRRLHQFPPVSAA